MQDNEFSDHNNGIKCIRSNNAVIDGYNDCMTDEITDINDRDGSLDGIRPMVGREEIEDDFLREFRTLRSNITGLNRGQKGDLGELILEFRDIFAGKARCTNIYEHKIKLAKETPFVKRTYPIPHAYRDKVKKEINSMLEQGIIERSDSDFCSPMHVVKKRMAVLDCVWMRGLLTKLYNLITSVHFQSMICFIGLMGLNI